MLCGVYYSNKGEATGQPQATQHDFEVDFKRGAQPAPRHATPHHATSGHLCLAASSPTAAECLDWPLHAKEGEVLSQFSHPSPHPMLLNHQMSDWIETSCIRESLFFEKGYLNTWNDTVKFIFTEIQTSLGTAAADFSDPCSVKIEWNPANLNFYEVML
ncbi:hypothetical protein SLEP1_g58738 [Rubroshorea leprosula]|uniref:Uncharacterized protein n=1 Tax=Rubroshorea leprosula TaxID=152421 RepID=A0AAV5MQ99_9ROSI|nr:hypothetical protein SLEP1_g58738 [Rubroshorea leprosula]